MKNYDNKLIRKGSIISKKRKGNQYQFNKSPGGNKNHHPEASPNKHQKAIKS